MGHSSFLNILLDIFHQNNDNTNIHDVLLRLLCEWSYQSTSVITYILKNIHSYDLFTNLYKSSSTTTSTTKTLLCIFLGIVFQYFPSSSSTTTEEEEENIGGWTKTSLFSLISQNGLYYYFNNIDENQIQNVVYVSKNDNLSYEENFYNDWLMNVTSTIRHSIVLYLTTNNKQILDSKDDKNHIIQKQHND